MFKSERVTQQHVSPGREARRACVACRLAGAQRREDGVAVFRVLSRKSLKNWWAIQVLNLWPLPCEGSALPLS